MYKKAQCILVIFFVQLTTMEGSVSFEELYSLDTNNNSSVIDTVFKKTKIDQSDSVSREESDAVIDALRTKRKKEEASVIEGDTPLVLKKKEKSPKVAGLLSVMLPGAGQVYNRGYKAWWKVGVIYGGAYLLYRNISFYSKAKEFYHGALVIHDMDTTSAVIEGELVKYVNTYENVDDYSDISAEAFSKRDVDDIEVRFNGTRSDLQSMYIFSFVLYGLNILDAVVDAHLKSFDVSDDISMRIKPSVLNMNGTYNGLGPALSLKFSLK
jgi:hypothetical protein